jgi:predicted dehydrogenase
MNSTNHPSRRRFMYGVATTAAATFAGPYILRAAEPGKEKLRIAFVGTAGRAGAHLGLISTGNEPRGGGGRRNRQNQNQNQNQNAQQDANQNQNQNQAQAETPRQPEPPSIVRGHICPAYTDIDPKRWDRIAQIAPKATGYTDYRQMFDKHMKEIDAVVTAVPDHNHACPTAIALREGKHCYTEKPLTWSVAEARALAELAAQKKVATQMGNHGHANEGNRLVVEWIRGGVIGDVTEIHTWTNRPIWPQGIQERPATEPIPEKLDWDCWIGPAPYRDYHKGLHNFAWRGWFDFGCGAIGDMGCHTWDCVFWAMNPDYPSSVELLKIVGQSKETYPKQSITRWDFPAKGPRPAFQAYWYEGGLKPPAPEEWSHDADLADKDAQGNIKPRPLPNSGSLFIGTKSKLLVQGDYGNSPRLIPEKVMKATKLPPKTIPRSPGYYNEWIMAAMGDKPWNFPGSNFADYAGPLTENMLLGAIAIRLGEGFGKIECDPIKKIIKTPAALQYASRQYRRGWPQVSPQSAIS